jgi:N6-adenosine-specific RNA methylase IME4
MVYSVILADPPWKYNSRANHKTRFRGGACGHYDLMSTKDICNLPVSDLADPEGCILFLWATFPMLQDAFRVIEAWGFKYKTIGFTWGKLNTRAGTPFFGVGHYTKSNAEPCLIATRGRVLKPAVDTVSSLILAPRREHSRKPDEAHERIEQLYPGHRKIELFARRARPGWDVWGNQVESDIALARGEFA